MALTLGSSLGPYRIVERVGAGGMGEVYKAHDTRLNRTVAIKVLPASLTSDPVAKRRFEREARAVAALSSPHICPLYDIGHDTGTDFLVMEYLEGETLRDRLARGRLPLKQAIRYGTDIAAALSAAHRAGVVHRDLKPANVMLTESGAMLLDFGIARLPEVVETRTSAPVGSLTVEGSVLGTIPYMAPEQVEGRLTDTLTDIFAFGAVMYEMVSGRRAFAGDSDASIAAAILTTHPTRLAEIDPGVPASLEHLVEVCLAKDPSKRWQSAADVVMELEWVNSERLERQPGPVPTARRRLWTLPIVAFATCATGIAAALIWSERAQPTVPIGPPARFEIPLPAGSQLLDAPALSRDGTRIAFSALDKDGVTRIYLRHINEVDSTPLSAAEGGRAPFFSPDGRSLAFFGRGGLKVLPLGGGPSSVIVSFGHDPGTFRGGVWGSDGITFAAWGNVGLTRVSESGGAVDAVTTPAFDADEVGHLWPEELPGGRAFVFTTTGRTDPEPFKISIHSSDRPGHRDLLEPGRNARYSPSGHLLYTVANSLLAVPFDTRTLRVTGKPVPILKNVAGIRNAGIAFFSVSESSTLAYGPGPDITSQRTPVWIGADGVETPLTNVPPGLNLNDAHASLTGTYVLFSGGRTASTTDLWVHDIVRGSWNPLTRTAAPDFAPVWASDPERVFYSSSGRTSAYDLYSISADGSSGPELVFESLYNKFPSSWSPTTKRLAYVEYPTQTNADIWLLDLSGPAKPSVFANDPRFREGGPDFSPDGRWLAYDSDESGRTEVFVRPVGRSGKKLPVSTQGGMRPRWSRDGTQLSYINNDTLMVTRILSAGDELRPVDTSVRARFPYVGGAVANYAIIPDGRVLRIRHEPTAVVVDRLVVVQDWVSQLLKRSDSR